MIDGAPVFKPSDFIIRAEEYGIPQKGTPTFSLIFAAIMNLVLINIGSFTTLFALGAFMAVTVFLFAYIALVKLRIKRPEAARPYRAWGYPYTTILLILFSIGLFIGFAFSDPRNFLVIIVVTLLSYPAYILMVKREIIAS